MSHYINTYKNTISNIFIGISVIFTTITYIYPGFFIYGMNDYFLKDGKYYIYFLQFFTSNFIHGGILHLFFNSVFIYYFGNQVEQILRPQKYLMFFIFNAIFIGIGLTLLGSPNTVGISGFALAILTYFTLELKSRKIEDYKGGITAIIVNIAIGLHPQISLFGHLLGVISGLIFYFLNKKFLKKLLTPVMK